MMSSLIRRKFTPYQASSKDPSVALALDRTEPPIPYRDFRSEECFGWSRYPSVLELESKIASRFGVGSECVLITAGADEALDRAFRAIVLPGDEVLTTDPIFEMIPKYIQLSGAQTKEVPWLDREFPFDSLTEVISSRTRIIVLVTPNNPTGQTVPLGMLQEIAVRNPDVVLVLDLAYIEFSDFDPSMALLQSPNVVLVRSFSKAWGLPGLRVGYAIANPEIIQAMRAAGGPYSVAASSIEVIRSNFDLFEREMTEYVDAIKDERARLESWLRQEEIRFLPSNANFILLFPDVPQNFDRTLFEFGIRTRALPSLPGARRLTLPGNTEAFALLQSALERSFQFQKIAA